MKPDHEINGRYFVDGYILRDIPRENNYVIIISNKSKYQVDQSLPLGKCFVELEKFYGVGNNSVAYEIKLDQSGKAVVLTELPKENSFPCMSDDGECEKQCDCCKFVENGIKNKQSDDELACDIFKNTAIEMMGSYSDKGFKQDYAMLHRSIIKAMKEYHRVKSEGLFTREEIENFLKWMKDIRVYLHTDGCIEYKIPFDKTEGLYNIFNKWLESKNK